MSLTSTWKILKQQQLLHYNPKKQSNLAPESRGCDDRFPFWNSKARFECLLCFLAATPASFLVQGPRICLWSRQSGCQESQRKCMRKPMFFVVCVVQMVEKNQHMLQKSGDIQKQLTSWKISISIGVFTKELLASRNPNRWHLLSFHFMERQSCVGFASPSDAWRWWKLRGFYWKNKHLLVPNGYIWDHLIHFPNQPRFAGKFLRKHSIPWGLGNVDFSQFFLAGKLGQVAGFWIGKKCSFFKSLAGHQTTRRWPTAKNTPKNSSIPDQTTIF